MCSSSWLFCNLQPSQIIWCDNDKDLKRHIWNSVPWLTYLNKTSSLPSEPFLGFAFPPRYSKMPYTDSNQYSLKTPGFRCTVLQAAWVLSTSGELVSRILSNYPDCLPQSLVAPVWSGLTSGRACCRQWVWDTESSPDHYEQYCLLLLILIPNKKEKNIVTCQGSGGIKSHHPCTGKTTCPFSPLKGGLFPNWTRQVINLSATS